MNRYLHNSKIRHCNRSEAIHSWVYENGLPRTPFGRSRNDGVFYLCALFFLFISFFASPPLHASEWVEARALAMHGSPKLTDDFSHFPYANPDAPKGGLMRLNIVGTFDSVNPYIVKGRAAQGLTYIYETLMARSQDEPFTLYPLLAEKIAVKADRSAIRFFLNPKAKWQDGTPITADDILFSWQTLRDKGRPNHRSYYKKVVSAKKEDARSVTFTFAPDDKGGIDREMPLIMGLMPVLPKHIWEKGGFDETSLTPPVASGPYKLSKIESGRSTTFTRDENYWGKDLPSRRGTCNFDTIRYDYYRDENVAQEAFTAGQLDARRETDPKRWTELQRIEKEKPNSFRTLAFPHQRPEPAHGFIFNTRRPAFANREIRKALAHLFDFDWVNKTLFHGVYKRSLSYYANSELASSGLPTTHEIELLKELGGEFPKAILENPFSLPSGKGAGPAGMRTHIQNALQVFKENGYSIKNQKMHNADGTPFTFEIVLSDPQDEKIALEYSRILERIGITTVIRTVDASQFQARLNDFDYDVILFRWINSLSPGNEQTIYWGSLAADQQGSRNYAGIQDPLIDALIGKVMASVSREDLLTAIHAIDRLLLNDYYMVPLFYRGTDLFAIWNTIAVPETVPLYGPVVETWWGKP